MNRIYWLVATAGLVWGVALGGGAVWCFKPTTKIEQVAPRPDTRTEEEKIGDTAYAQEYYFRLKLIEEGKDDLEIRDLRKYLDLSPKGNVEAAQKAKQQALADYREANRASKR